jgi:hypothetical protein
MDEMESAVLADEVMRGPTSEVLAGAQYANAMRG